MTPLRYQSEADLRQAEQWLADADPQMAELIRRFGPCQMRPWEKDLFTSIISSIVSQQLSVKAAETIFNRLTALFDNPATLDAASLVEVSHEQLRACGLSNAKSRYVMGIAAAVVNGDLQPEQLKLSRDEEIHTRLIKLAGVGQWTVEMLLIFAVGSSDILSTADLGLKRGMMRLLEMPDYPSETQFQTRAALWSPHRSVACWYLWRLAE